MENFDKPENICGNHFASKLKINYWVDSTFRNFIIK